MGNSDSATRSNANTPVSGAYDIKQRFTNAGKNNLTLFTFDRYDHDLNFAQWVMRGTESEGISKMVEVARQLMLK